MTDLDKIMANLAKPEDVEAERAKRRARLVSSAAAGLFACATDITTMNREAGVEDGAEILLEASALFVAQLYEGVHRGMGKTHRESRELLEKAVKDALFNVRRAAERAEGETVQ